MEYSVLISELNKRAASVEYVRFQQKILRTDKKIIGVRTPDMRDIIKRHRGEYYSFKNFPDEFYEVAFIKIGLAADLSYAELINELPNIISVMDCWALTDAFASPAIKNNRADFKKYIEKYIYSDGVFSRRVAIIILLKYYLDGEYAPYALKCVERCDRVPYYVSMAAAWLVAEAVIKNCGGIELLKSGSLDKLTQNRAIQKSRDSFRLTSAQKEELKQLKKH